MMMTIMFILVKFSNDIEEDNGNINKILAFINPYFFIKYGEDAYDLLLVDSYY